MDDLTGRQIQKPALATYRITLEDGGHQVKINGKFPQTARLDLKHPAEPSFGHPGVRPTPRNVGRTGLP